MRHGAFVVLLLTAGCGLDELVTGYPTGAGGGSCAIDTARAAERGTFTTQSTEPAEILALDLPGEIAPDGWIVLLSARLASQSSAPASQEVRYLVDGVERGLGQSRVSSPEADDGGPWQHFDWVAPGSGTRQVTVDFRSTNAQYLATIEDLRVVAFAVPAGADLVFVDQPDAQLVMQPDTNRIFQTVASVDIAPSAPGEYLVLLAVLGSEEPGVASIGVRAVAPGAEVWPVESQVDPRPYLAQPLSEWQSFWLMRTVQTDGTAISVDLQIDGSGAEGSTIRHARGLALRTDSFVQARTAARIDEQVVDTADETTVAELELTADPCNGLVVAQSVVLQSLGLRTVRFGNATFDHQLVSDESKLTYGTFGLVPGPAATLATRVSAPDTTIPLYVRESVLVALELP